VLDGSAGQDGQRGIFGRIGTPCPDCRAGFSSGRPIGDDAGSGEHVVDHGPMQMTPEGNGLSSGPDVVITGIPRSGTSYFCTVFNALRDCVAINEPEEIFRHLGDVGPPWGLRNYYASMRAEILAGRPVVNMLADGRFIEDTATGAREQFHVHPVSGVGFLFATKNTLAYLARLPQVVAALPDATCLACIRHPFDTIASWKSTFHNLTHAAVQAIRVGFVGDPLLTEAGRARVAEIAATEPVERRRALLWRHLALLLLEAGPRVAEIIPYESLVSDPETVMRRLWADVIPTVPRFEPLRPLERSAVRHARRASLTVADVAAIREACGEVASRFGYDVAGDPLAGEA
jgi:hypothetical protein